MKLLAWSVAVMVMLSVGLMANAQTPQISQAPPTVTATCKDGTTYSGTTRSGACRGHGGVKSFASDTAAPTTADPALSAPTKPSAPTAAAAAGQVWVNTASHVYHCPGDHYYGKTKAGTYMTEAAAKSAGNRPDHGKACS